MLEQAEEWDDQYSISAPANQTNTMMKLTKKERREEMQHRMQVSVICDL